LEGELKRLLWIVVNGVVLAGYCVSARADSTSVVGEITTSSLTVTGPVSASTLTVGGIVGVANGSNAMAGNVGEYIFNSLPQASPVTIPGSGPMYNVISSTLTAGDWNVTGIAMVLNSATNQNQNMASLSIYPNNTTTDLVWGGQCNGGDRRSSRMGHRS